MLGHIHIFKDFSDVHPADVNIYVFHTWFAEHFEKYFEEPLAKVPPVVYLDLWPVGPGFALVYDSKAAAQFTKSRSLPKFTTAVKYIKPLTGNLDIITAEGRLWKEWRSLFNTVFSTRNIQSLVADLVDEVSIFANGLSDTTHGECTFGPVFPLLEKTTNLTFDIMCKAILLVFPESPPPKMRTRGSRF